MGSLGAIALVVGYLTQMERADRARAISLFGKFVSRSLVDNFWEQRELFMDGDRPRPQRARVTLLLSDLFGYTSMAEKADPSEVLDWLGTYTDRMAMLVEDHGGLVNDFLGDGLMATFGAPVPRESDAEVAVDAAKAVECALAMNAALEEMNETWRQAGQPTARLRVGILTGPAMMGCIGSSDRMKYATVGNTVNTAARLESHDKLSFEEEDTTCRILIGQATLDCLGSRFETKCIGDHVLKGRGEPVTIHRVFDVAGEDV
jgi:adenylate cyclase